MTYNGVNLGSFMVTESVNHLSDMDPTGTDQLYTGMRIEILTMLHPGCLAAVGGETPGQTLTRIRHLLTAPRAPLSYTSPDGATQINLPGGIDDANGPKPELLTLQHVTGQSFLVRFAVVVRLVDCTPLPTDFLSLRWDMADSYDRTQVCTRRTVATLILSSRGPGVVDDYRPRVTPGVPVGFRREHAAFEMQSDGLKYRATFIDKQLMPGKTPPYPALRITGNTAQSVPLRGGLTKGRLHLRADGPPGVSPQDLLSVLIRIGMSRVYASGVAMGKGNRIMVGGGFETDEDDDVNAVSLDLEWNISPTQDRVLSTRPVSANPLLGAVGAAATAIGLLGGGKAGPAVASAAAAGIAAGITAVTQQGKREDGIAAIPAWVGLPYPGTDPTAAIGPPTRGWTQNMRLFAAMLNDPCLQTTTISTGPGSSDNYLVGTSDGGTPVTLSVVGQIQPDDYTALYSADDTPGVYSYYKLSAEYHDSAGNLVIRSTDPTKPAKEVVHAAGLLKCQIGWSVERIGAPPELPAKQPTDPNVVYLDGTIEHHEPDLAADGVSYIYAVSGNYRYAFLDRTKVNVAAPIPPFLDFSITKDVAIRAAQLVSANIGFPAKPGDVIVNPFTGQGVEQELSSDGTQGGPTVGP